MLDEAKRRAVETPGHKYNLNFDLIRPKSAIHKIVPNLRVKG